MCRSGPAFPSHRRLALGRTLTQEKPFQRRSWARLSPQGVWGRNMEKAVERASEFFPHQPTGLQLAQLSKDVAVMLIPVDTGPRGPGAEADTGSRLSRAPATCGGPSSCSRCDSLCSQVHVCRRNWLAPFVPGTYYWDNQLWPGARSQGRK